MNCITCNTVLSKKGKFCPSCGTQIKCKSCDELLLKDAKACISCGEFINPNNIPDNSSPKIINSIEYRETKESRTFKASFSDSIGENMSSVIANFWSNKLKSTNLENSHIDQETTDFEEIEDESEVIKENLNLISQDSDILKIFAHKEGSWILTEPRLKASNRIDFARRLILLFLYLKSEVKEDVNRKDLSKILEQASVNTGNVRKYIIKTVDFTKSGEFYHLNLPGVEKAKLYLREVFDDTIENRWDITKSSNKRSSNKRSSNNQRKVNNYDTLDLGLSESERNTLRLFYKSKAPKNQEEISLLLAYWLNINKNKKELNFNEIHSGFQILEKRTPKDLRRIMNDNISKGRIIRSENKTYSINSIGKDYIKHSLPKKKP